MTGQAGQFQPSGQNLLPSVRSGLVSLTAFPLAWLLLALVLLAGPFNRGGLWDPQELRIAELARRLSLQLYGSNAAHFATERFAQVTKSQIGQGELGVTSPALGFALFGGSDWAGRVTSLTWGAVTILCLWIVMGRLAGRIAQVTSVLVLATLPLFAWQSRMMLGDAPTIGSLALSTSALLLAQLEPQAGLAHRTWRRPLFFWSMALLGLVAGVLCRGILIGVAVPTLSVGLVGMVHRRVGIGVSPLARFMSVLLFGIGLAAAAIGVRELLTAPAGFSFWLGATLTDVPQPSPFVAALSSLLHQTFPLSAFLPVGIAIALARSAAADARGVRGQSLAAVLAFTVASCLVVCSVFLTRGVAMPFPALAALAGLSGLAIERLHRRSDVSVVMVGAVVLTIAVLLFADFVNLPDSVMLTTGMRNARFPESFNAEGRVWLGISTAVLGLGCVFVALSNRPAAMRGEPVQARYGNLFKRIRMAFDGQLLSGFVLVETALGTTSLLQRAHDRGWISVPAFDSIRTLAGSFLAWVWLVPPLLLFVVPLGYTTLQLAVDWLTTPGCGAARLGQSGSVRLRFILGRFSLGVPQTRLSSGLMLAVSLVLSGLVVSLGHAPAMAQRVSPKRAIAQYQVHARPGEPLALLGTKPESVGYYLGANPEAFGDIEAAAQWLHSSGKQRRWLTFGNERLAEINAAFRSISSGRNLAIVEPLTGNTLLATSELRGSERDHNPLSSDILTQSPPTAHEAAIEFGQVVRLIGWDIKSISGSSVAQLTAGQPYELVLVFQVLGTMAVDWQVFVHLDGRGRRHNGDHEPVAGRYPTTLWQPPDIVVDRHKMVLERGALPGPHVLYVGLFRGNKRLDVSFGNHEDNRVKLGDLEVK